MSRLRIPVVELRRRVGNRRQIVESIHLEDASVADTAVPGEADVELDLVAESVLEGVMVEGSIHAPWTAPCRRCLEPVEGAMDVEVRELFEQDATPGETYPIEDDHIDLEPLVRDAVLLALPLSPLCSDTCRGPDPERFPAHLEDEPGHEERGGDGDGGPEGDSGPEGPTPRDPRWAALDQLHFEE